MDNGHGVLDVPSTSVTGQHCSVLCHEMERLFVGIITSGKRNRIFGLDHTHIGTCSCYKLGTHSKSWELTDFKKAKL